MNFLFNEGYERWTIISTITFKLKMVILHELSRLEYLACRRDAILLYTLVITLSRWKKVHIVLQKYMSVGYQDIGTAKHCGRNQFVQTCGSSFRIEQQSWCHLCTTLSNLLLLTSFFTSSKVKLVNIRSEDIVDGSPKLTLGLIWTIILYYQVSCSLFSGFSRQFKEDEGKFN